MLRIALLLAIAVIAGWQLHDSTRPVAPATPIATSPDHPWEHAGFRITPRQRFDMTARVLSAQTYRHDAAADIAPVDLALGWGPMADPAVLRNIAISQSNRFYFWRATHFPIPRRTIESHSANMHMIPATRAIEKRLRAIGPGQQLRLSGYLVDADSASIHLRTSLTRFDTGPGACEIVWIEELEVH